jgi:hypothetical protein
LDGAQVRRRAVPQYDVGLPVRRRRTMGGFHRFSIADVP